MIASRYDLSLLTNELLKASKNSVAVVILLLLFNILIKLSVYFFISTLLIKTVNYKAPSVNSVGALLFIASRFNTAISANMCSGPAFAPGHLIL